MKTVPILVSGWACAGVLALSLAAVGGASAAAQTPPAARPAASAEPTVEDSAILPSAGGGADGAAPSMALDCERDPASCENPLTEPSEGPALSTPSAGPAAPDVGAPVTAKPGD